jgi:hypothetical protein
MSDRLLDLFRQLVVVEAQRDSLEVGSAGSRIKIYGSFDDEATFAEKIDRALSLRAHALERLAEEEGAS